MLVGLDIEARVLHILQSGGVVHGYAQMSALLLPHLVEDGELLAQLIADGNIFFVAELNEMSLGLTQLFHQRCDLHFLSLTYLYVARDVEPAGHTVDR